MMFVSQAFSLLFGHCCCRCPGEYFTLSRRVDVWCHVFSDRFPGRPASAYTLSEERYSVMNAGGKEAG